MKSYETKVFEERGKLEYPGEKPLRAEKRTNILNPYMTLSTGIEHGSILVEGECSHHHAIIALCLID